MIGSDTGGAEMSADKDRVVAVCVVCGCVGAGVGLEGQGLVRTSSVVREEGAITQGLAQEWRGLQEELGVVMQWVGEGWGSGSAKKLLLLRRLLVDLQNTRAHLKDLTVLRQQEEAMQQAAAQGSSGEEAAQTDTQPTATGHHETTDRTGAWQGRGEG